MQSGREFETDRSLGGAAGGGGARGGEYMAYRGFRGLERGEPVRLSLFPTNSRAMMPSAAASAAAPGETIDSASVVYEKRYFKVMARIITGFVDDNPADSIMPRVLHDQEMLNYFWFEITGSLTKDVIICDDLSKVRKLNEIILLTRAVKDKFNTGLTKIYNKAEELGLGNIEVDGEINTFHFSEPYYSKKYVELLDYYNSCYRPSISEGVVSKLLEEFKSYAIADIGEDGNNRKRLLLNNYFSERELSKMLLAVLVKSNEFEEKFDMALAEFDREIKFSQKIASLRKKSQLCQIISISLIGLMVLPMLFGDESLNSIHLKDVEDMPRSASLINFISSASLLLMAYGESINSKVEMMILEKIEQATRDRRVFIEARAQRRELSELEIGAVGR